MTNKTGCTCTRHACQLHQKEICKVHFMFEINHNFHMTAAKPMPFSTVSYVVNIHRRQLTCVFISDNEPAVINLVVRGNFCLCEFFLWSWCHGCKGMELLVTLSFNYYILAEFCRGVAAWLQHSRAWRGAAIRGGGRGRRARGARAVPPITK